MTVSFENVGVRYEVGDEILQDVTFRLQKGKIYFLTGPSGSGKSTLLKLMYLGLRPNNGLISLFGYDVATVQPKQAALIHQRTGIVFQDFRLLEHISVFDNVALPLRLQKYDEKSIKDHVTELLTWVGLEKQMHARPNTLSGGQKQRAAIARAVIMRPKLMLADEPTGNLDDEIADRLMRLFNQLPKLGTTVVVATHNSRLYENNPDCSRLILEDKHIYLQENN